jgi:signal transduction histidine kinase
LNAAEGIYRIPADSIRSVLSGSPRPVEFELFDWVDGLNSELNPVRPVPSMLKTPDGRLWFARYEGVWSIDPAHIQRNLIPPIVTIEGLVSGGIRYEAGSALRLPKASLNLRIDYTAAALTYPERTRFRYRLVGLDEGWQEAGQRRQAYYTNLGPGHYEFRVRAVNKDGIWSEHDAVLEFTRAPAFYQTLVFKVVMAAASLMLLVLLFFVRVEQIQRRYRRGLNARHAERERIARDVHDTLLQGVQALLFRLQIWEEDPTVPESLRKEMTGVVRQTKSMVVEGRERILLMRRADRQPTHLAESLAAIGNEASAGERAAFEISVAGRQRGVTVDAQDQLLDIVREAVRNAYQHADAARIVVSLQYRRRSLVVSVADDGRGIDPAMLTVSVASSHFGLVGMQERAKQLGARFRIQSRAGTGTLIEVVVPAHTAFRDGFRWLRQRAEPT